MTSTQGKVLWDLDAGRELMRRAWQELNAIRARDGAPEGVSEEYWNELVDGLGKLLGEDAKPWMTGAAREILDRLYAKIGDAECRVAVVENENEQLRTALLNYANHQPLYLKKPSQIQQDLKAIAGEKHNHVASAGSTGSDACLLCGRDLRDSVHARAILGDAP